MKIAMIGQKGIPAIYGGVERHVEELAKQMAKKGHEILVYSRAWYTPKNIKKVGSIKIVHTPGIKTKNLDAITHTFTASIHAIFQKPDIIHYHAVGPSLLAWIPRIFAPKIKVVVTSHCLDRHHQKWGLFARIMLRMGEWTAAKFAHQTITVSKTLKNYYLNEYTTKTKYIPNGIKEVPKNIDSNIIEDKWDLKKDKYILMVSRLVKHKGAHYLIDAWQFARTQYPKLFRDYKLVIAGGSAHTDNYVKELKRMARGDKSIVFTSWQKGKSLEQLFANTSMLVHPSENEGLPITVLEAMSYGKAVLASDIPEHKEIITDSKYWFNNASISSLSDKLIELFKEKRTLPKVGKSNKKLVEKDFNWKDIGEMTLKLYSKTSKKSYPNKEYCTVQ